MQIHILGICGVFMGSIAMLAKQMGHQVIGSDMDIYPPMSTQLQSAGIELIDGYSATQLKPSPDLVIIGNTLSRGNECVEFVLNNDLSYSSGPKWLAENILPNRHVLAVSGTHGKTTTASLLAWILDSAGMDPGFLIGGIATNFSESSRLTDAELFVVEADEYDTAFFDKRSKFIHYRPKTLIINNIEFDHADIFADIGAIRREFHHLLRILPGQAQIIARHNDPEITAVIEMGCWTPVETFGIQSGDWTVQLEKEDYSYFHILKGDKIVGTLQWSLIGKHNAENALAAVIAANFVGVNPAEACQACGQFKSVKRRLEKLAIVNGITIYDDFAHHPTAIQSTLEGLRKHVGEQDITAILEPRSNTMKRGVHKHTLAAALAEADQILLYQPDNLSWDLSYISKKIGDKCRIYKHIEEIINDTVSTSKPGDHIVVMSNGAFDNIHQRLIMRLKS